MVKTKAMTSSTVNPFHTISTTTFTNIHVVRFNVYEDLFNSVMAASDLIFVKKYRERNLLGDKLRQKHIFRDICFFATKVHKHMVLPYMQKTYDVAEKAIFAKKKISEKVRKSRQKCVNRENR